MALHDYGDALHRSILFFEGQRSGRLPPGQRVRWRRASPAPARWSPPAARAHRTCPSQLPERARSRQPCRRAPTRRRPLPERAVTARSRPLSECARRTEPRKERSRGSTTTQSASVAGPSSARRRPRASSVALRFRVERTSLASTHAVYAPTSHIRVGRARSSFSGCGCERVRP